MSMNCIRCVANDRTGTDLLCDSCREKDQEILDKARILVRKEGRCSPSLLQQRLAIGYTQASLIINELIVEGIINPDLTVKANASNHPH